MPIVKLFAIYSFYVIFCHVSASSLRYYFFLHMTKVFLFHSIFLCLFFFFFFFNFVLLGGTPGRTPQPFEN